MKKKSGVLFSVITVLVLGFGLFLPRIASALQYQSSIALSQQYAVKTIELETMPPVAISDVLVLMSGAHKSMELETGNVRDSAQAHESALEALSFIEDYGISFNLEVYTIHRWTPVLIFAEDGEEAAVLWRCEFTASDGSERIVLYLDDESGKMVSFLYASLDLAEHQTSVAHLNLTADNWAEMCVKYYGFQSVGTKENIMENGVKTYDLTFIDYDGKELTLPYDENTLNLPFKVIEKDVLDVGDTVQSGNTAVQVNLNVRVRFNYYIP